MATRLALDINAMQESFFADTAMIGVVSALSHYRFCWVLNNHFDIELQREPDMDICLSGSEGPVYFPLYQYCTPLSSTRHTIYRLRSGSIHLLPEVKQLDYLWMIESASCESDARILNQGMRAVSEVQLSQILDTSKLKSIGNLLV